MTDTEQNSRMIARFVAATTLASLWATSRVLGTKTGKAARVDRAVIFLAILDHSLSSAEKTGNPVGVSVHAMAMSLSRPFESIRRQVNVLIADGWCNRAPSGIVVDPSIIASPGIQRLVADLHDWLIWLVEQYRTFDLPLPATRPAAGDLQALTSLTAIQLVLAAVDFGSLSHSNIRDFYIVHWVTTASVHKVIFNPILTRQYGGLTTVPDDHYRAGVSIQRLSTLLELPPVTVYRQINKAISAGQLERCDGGVRGTQTYLNSNVMQADIRLASQRADRAFQRLAMAGFPFDDPARCYSGAPPEMPDWDA